MKFPSIFQKLALPLQRLLLVLRAKTPIGGLEISDAALRFAYYNGKTWALKGTKLPPGVLEEGKIKNEPEFAKILKTFHRDIENGNDHKVTNVVVGVSSLDVYTQSIALPAVKRENVDRAVDLNLKIASPSDFDSLYTGWQFLSGGEKSGQVQVMGAFAPKVLIDDLLEVLKSAHFIPVAVEPRSLSLVRLARTWGLGVEPEKAYIILTLDSAGMDFLIMRNGDLYFDYFASWRGLQEPGTKLSLEGLRTALVKSLNQVVNYYEQHWKSPPLSTVFILAGDLYQEVKTAVTANYSFDVKPFSLKVASATPPDWYAVLGVGIRGTVSRREDKEISLMGLSAMKEFTHQQMFRFLNFWSVLIPSALAVLLLVFVGARVFLVRTGDALSESSKAGINNVQQTELNALLQQAADFNKVVGALTSVQGSFSPKGEGVESILNYLNAQGVAVTDVSFPGYGLSISVNGKISSIPQLLALKKNMESNPAFQDVNLPPAAVQPQPDGSAAFSMSFSITTSSLKTP